MASYCDTGMEPASYFQLEGRGTPEAKATELHLLRTAFRLKRRRLHRVRGRLQIADSRLGTRWRPVSSRPSRTCSDTSLALTWGSSLSCGFSDPCWFSM